MLFRSPGFRLSLALGLAATGCSSAPEDAPEDVGQTHHEIRDGYTDETDKAVVGIFNAQFGGICSGSLLAPNVVLTARHCVSDILDEADGGGISCDQTRFSGAHAAERFFVTTHTEMTDDPARYRAVREVVLLPVGDEFCGNDQAILILSDLIPESEAVPLVPRVDVPIVKDEQYYAVGYGATSGENVGAGLRRRRDTLFIDCVADACPERFVTPTEWVGDTGICEGDSGGPSLDLVNRVIGVTSRGSDGCDSPVYGYVLSWAQWIKDSTLHAAQLGGYQAPAWATGFPTDPAYTADMGGACNATEECAANACLNGYCTRPCSEVATCPSGFTCTGEPRFCAQIEVKQVEEEESSTTSCSFLPSPDPTKPIPWLIGIASLGASAALRRRRGRARLD